MKLIIGIPCLDFMPVSAVTPLVALALRGKIVDSKLRKEEKIFDMLFAQGNIIPDSRRGIVEAAIARGGSHLLFLDSDIVLEPDTIGKLVSHHKDIVCATYNSRYNEHAQLGNRDMGAEPSGGLLPMATVPLGCALIKLSIFNDLQRPWFNYELGDVPGKVRDVSEDSWFCRRAREAGMKIWLDPSIKLGHTGIKVF